MDDYEVAGIVRDYWFPNAADTGVLLAPLERVWTVAYINPDGGVFFYYRHVGTKARFVDGIFNGAAYDYRAVRGAIELIEDDVFAVNAADFLRWERGVLAMERVKVGNAAFYHAYQERVEK